MDSSAAAARTTQFVGFGKIEPKEEQMEESDVSENEQQLNETGGAAQLQQQQQLNNETSEAAIEHDDNNDDDDMPFEGSFICICYVVSNVCSCAYFVIIYIFDLQQCQRANKCIVSSVING